MDENVVFRTAAVGGFEKRAVLDYIYQMNEQTEQDKQDLRNRIVELEEGLRLTEQNMQGASNNLRAAQRDLSTLSSELAEEKKARLELMARREQLEKEVLHQKEITINKEQEVDAFITKNKGILEQNKSLVAQQEEIDKASYQLGRVMLDARTDADNIVSGAREQAEGLVSQAELDIGEMRRSSEKQAAEHVASAREKAQAELDSAKKQVAQMVKDAQAVAEKTLQETKEQSDLAIAQVRERATVIVGATSEAADVSTVHLRELRRETLAIRQVITEALGALQKKADELDGRIGLAQDTLAQEQVSTSVKKLTELAEINMDRIGKEYRESQKAEPPSPEEVHLPAPLEAVAKQEPAPAPPPIDGEGTTVSVEQEVKLPEPEVLVAEPKEGRKERRVQPEGILFPRADTPEEALNILKQKEPELVLSFHEEIIVEKIDVVDQRVQGTEEVRSTSESQETPPLTSDLVFPPEVKNPQPEIVLEESRRATIGTESHLLAKDDFPAINLDAFGKEEGKKEDAKTKSSEDKELINHKSASEAEPQEQDRMAKGEEEKRELPPCEPLYAWERRGDKQTVTPRDQEGKEGAKSYPPGLEAPDKNDASTQGTFF